MVYVRQEFLPNLKQYKYSGVGSYLFRCTYLATTCVYARLTMLPPP